MFLPSQNYSDATKSLSRKMKTNFASAVTNLVPKSPTSEDLQHVLGLNNSQTSPQQQEAEAESVSQRQAAADADLLKSIVEPLEEQIGALKQKLRDTDLLLGESEKRHAKSVMGVAPLADWLAGQADVDQALSSIQVSQKFFRIAYLVLFTFDKFLRCC